MLDDGAQQLAAVACRLSGWSALVPACSDSRRAHNGRGIALCSR
jgi:hypothetical protein